MLKRIIIEQFVIIDKLDVELKSGLTILTGETGAGKSIILDALLLLLGDNSNPAAIRQGAEQSIIEGHFAPPASNLVWAMLSEQGYASATEGQFVIRRIVKQSGEDDIQLNGKPVDLSFLKKLGRNLGEIHGQNANQILLDPANQLLLLDMFGCFPPEFHRNVAEALRNVHRYKREQEEESLFLNTNMRNLAQWEDLVKRFEATGLHEQDVEVVKAEHARLLTAFESCEAFQEIIAHLISSTGAIRSLTASNFVLTRSKNLNAEKMKNLAGFLETALENARLAVSETAKLSPEYEIDTKPLHVYRARVAAMQVISEELKVPVDDLSRFYKDLTGKLSRVKKGRERITELGELMKQAEDDFRRHAHVLTEKRIEAGLALDKEINAELPRLKLTRAEFKVEVVEAMNNPWTELGFNVVTFTGRMNPGMPFSPIAETASGGELARLVLSVKVVLQAIQKIPTLVFDEVDVGIGGSAAAALGERIAHVADTTQVMAITHSPQVAARGHQHLYVSKKTDGVTTTSAIRTLTLDERIGEISRMLAGEVTTEESSSAARSLIEEAVVAGEVRRQNLNKQS